MKKTGFELNYEGVGQLLKSEEMKNICKSYADAAVRKLGDGYSVSTYTGTTRVNASVRAETFEARKENSQNNTILKAVYG